MLGILFIRSKSPSDVNRNLTSNAKTRKDFVITQWVLSVWHMTDLTSQNITNAGDERVAPRVKRFDPALPQGDGGF